MIIWLSCGRTSPEASGLTPMPNLLPVTPPSGITQRNGLRRASGEVNIRPTTEAKYRGLLDRHLLDTFGDDKLSKIRKTKVQTWYDDLAAAHPSTAAGAYRLLATIFNRAVKEDRTPQSPCDVEGGSREPAAKRKIATPEECQAAIDAIPKHYEKYRCAVMLAAWGQLRRGELLALRRGDLDLDAGTVEIERPGW